MIGRRANEFLQVADFVAQEQGLDKESVFGAIEAALAKSAQTKYGKKNNISVTIDRDTGETKFFRHMKIVVEVLDPYKEVHFEETRHSRPELKVGDEILEELPPISYDRIDAQESRQVIIEKIQEKKRSMHYAEYMNRVGELVFAVVKRNEITYVLLEFGNKVEAILRKDDMLPQERLQPGERIKAVISEVKAEGYGPVIRLSRTNPKFLIELLREEVVEIQEGIIEIKAAARDPGSRAKIAVYCADRGIDAVGACVGIRGAKIQAVSAELMGEKIDVIEWTSNPANFVINALSPAEVSKVVIDEDAEMIEVIVPEDQFGMAIGKKGQNVKLASALTRWKISLLTEGKEAERYAESIDKSSQLFKIALGVDDMMGHLLAVEGYESIDQLAEEDVLNLASLEGFDKSLAEQIIQRAEEYLKKEQNEIIKFLEKEKIERSFIDFEGLSLDQKKVLVSNNVKSLSDLADLSGDELVEFLPFIKLDEANALIMILRREYSNLDEE